MAQDNKIIGDYLREVDEIFKDKPTEASYRPSLQNLLKGLAGTKEIRDKSGSIKVIHEPSQTKNVGAPDFMLLGESGAIIGYVECKKPKENLDDVINGKQIAKYRQLSDNALITDYRRFILLHKDNKPREVDLSAASARTPANKQKLHTLIADFMCAEIRKIDDPKVLASILAERCRALRDEMESEMSEGFEKSKTSEELRILLENFKRVLYHKITPEQFADALSQTVTYILLFAKLHNQDVNKLDMTVLKNRIPKNFDLIRGISGFLDSIEDTPLNYLLESILAVINAVDGLALTEKAAKDGGTDDDPYFYFYENFLAAYDANLRKSRGVYYTPPPAVKFIVRATDDILQRDFGKSKGLADSSVTALDFAAGTGTFMLEVIRFVLENKSPAKRDIVAREHLLKNLFGFEFLISSYVIAHMKLSAFFKKMGVDIKDDERVNVFLTNTLVPTLTAQGKLANIPALAREMKQAQKVKEQKILVITGNPPYSANSLTAGSEVVMRPSEKNPERMIKVVEDTWIGDLIRQAYYYVDGKSINEKNPKLLQDDYVKFIRFAQHKIEETGQGVVAIITNHGFLNNLTFRGMRQSLMETFDRLYFLDLHGNSRNREVAPDGGKDENIFDIQTGVVISLLVKRHGLSKGVFLADMWGKRESKEKICMEQNIESLSWKKLSPVSPSYLFVHQNKKVLAEYEKFYSLSDIFSLSSDNSGVKTGNDTLTIYFDSKEIKNIVKEIVSVPKEKARALFKVGQNKQGWEIDLAQGILREDELSIENIHPIAYRPFDSRYTFYTGKSGKFHSRPHYKIMRHMIEGDNIGLVSVKQTQAGDWQHVFVASGLVECCYVSNKSKETSYIFPLYCYDEEMGKVTRRENLEPRFRYWIDKHYGKKFSPEDILGYIYAVLHSPDYRQKYQGCLRFGYSRIPFPKDKKAFINLAKIGKELMDVHLLRTHCGDQIELCGKGTSHTMEKVRYDEKHQRLYFNDDEYLSPISPEVFNFKIGSYRPLEQFFKYRKDRNLSGADIDTLEKAANAIAYTVKAVKKIKLP